jgi:hypothetical protein
MASVRVGGWIIKKRKRTRNVEGREGREGRGFILVENLN